MDLTLAKQGEVSLIAAIKADLSNLEGLLEKCSGKWGYEDDVYRFYHQSFKVFRLQGMTIEIVNRLHALAPNCLLNEWFMQIVQEGTGKEFTPSSNHNWLPETRPILEAFFHAKYFLEMVIKYGGELDSPPDMLPSGWAAVLYLYGLR